METRFIEGGQYVDAATYIETRGECSRLRERVVTLEAEIVELRLRLDLPKCRFCDDTGKEVVAHGISYDPCRVCGRHASACPVCGSGDWSCGH